MSAKRLPTASPSSAKPVYQGPHGSGPTLSQLRASGNGARGTVSYDEVDTTLLRNAIVACTDAGAAILFGSTSDRGAFSVIVMDGNERIKEYHHSVEDLESMLRWLVGVFAPDK